MSKVFIIGEIGVNHNGDIKIAKKMVDVALDCGVDAVKTQTFKAKQVISRFAPKADYQKKTTNAGESQLEMASRLEFDAAKHRELLSYCRQRSIDFLSSPFDLESIDLLNKFGLKVFKIPSGEITNLPYLNKIGALKKRIIMSSGMADLEEIRKAVRILIKAGTPKQNITVLHCNTDYPTSFKDVNLLAMLTIRDSLGLKVGYSDHTPGIEIPIAAVALGAVIIEKHFTLDRNLPGPDHKASLEPNELKAMVKAIRNVEIALGDGVKRPSPSEIKNIAIVRKSIVAARAVRKGEVFTEENITTKRPGTGKSPLEWPTVIGKIAKKDFKEDELIEL